MTSSFQPSISQAQEAALPIHSPAEFEACIAALWVFPIKSCAGISVQQAVLTPTGLAHDRAWMVVDADGEMVTQRELPRMALIQPELVHSGTGLVELVLHASGMAALHLPLTTDGCFVRAANPSVLSEARTVKVCVWDDQVPAFDMGAEASKWLTDFLGNSLGPLRLVRFDDNHHRPSNVKWTQGFSSFNQFSDGFPVLVASTASLDELNARLQAKDEAMVDMRRFRANVVLGDMETSYPLNAHDEDRIGTLTCHTEHEAVQLTPVKPCPRCPIPNINPDSAQSHPAVNDTLQAYRQDPRVNGALTFGMNCLPVAGIGQVLRVGQRVSADWVF
ncbi:MOSC N-terminal beta barrel domain-containing protein [Limnohabitans sp. TEGF004]|uniref:MOSC domain-containing protein n=1 Tax=Limnohabitans sp. TEGF004 TaxID=2986281 RepID=UPI0023774D64|nr:MOSC N-terminal beta barrel domain-containing protein [Limnohabitans sp. TEGF004]BDU54818.1 Fe-S protein [Limnohabitans sp. TEGF004]